MHEVQDEAIRNNFRILARSIELLEENHRVEIAELKKEMEIINQKLNNFYFMVKGIKILTNNLEVIKNGQM